MRTSDLELKKMRYLYKGAKDGFRRIGNERVGMKKLDSYQGIYGTRGSLFMYLVAYCY